METLTDTISCCMGLLYASPNFSATWLKPTLALILALKRDSFFVLSTFCSASNTFWRSPKNCGLLTCAAAKASSTGITSDWGRPGNTALISVFFSKFRKEANENMARFKALVAFCKVLRALTTSSFKVSKSARLMAAILRRCMPIR